MKATIEGRRVGCPGRGNDEMIMGELRKIKKKDGRMDEWMERGNDGGKERGQERGYNASLG